MCHFWSTLRCNYPLIKHLGMWKCTITRLGVAIGKYSICPTNSHVKNEKLFTTRDLDTIAIQLVNGGQGKEKKKVHPICGNLASSQIKPSYDKFWTNWRAFQVFKGEELLLQTLVWFHRLDHGRSDSQCCLMGHKMCKSFLFIFMGCDEVTTIDNQSQLFVHVYVTEKWKRVLIMLNL